MFEKRIEELKTKSFTVGFTRGKGRCAVWDKHFSSFEELKSFFFWNSITLQYVKTDEKRFDENGFLEELEKALQI